MDKSVKKIETIGRCSNFFMILGAFMGSVMALIPEATKYAGLDSSMLKYAPFKTFVIPGLFLLLVLCGGNLLNALLFIKGKKESPYFLVVMGVILVLWLCIQCLLIWAIIPLHIIFLLVGIGQIYCGLKLIIKQSLPLPFSAKQN